MKQKKIKWLLYTLYLTYFALFFMPLTIYAGDKIKIGIISSLLPGGQGIKCSAKMAVDEINNNGGIGGKQIELIFADSKAKPAIGAYEYTRLVKQDKVVAVIGTSSSEIAIAVMEQVAKYQVPFIITGAASPKMTQAVKQNYEKYKYLFNVFHSSHEIAEFTTSYIINFAKINNLQQVAMVIESEVWTRPLANIWKKNLQNAGIEITVLEYIDKNTKDFKSIVSKIKETKAQAVYIAAAHMDLTTYINQWADTKGPVMAGVISTMPELWKQVGEKAVSIISMGYPGVLGITAKGSLFFEKYLQLFKTHPEYTSAYTYDAVYMLAKALEKAVSTKPDEVVQALEQTDYNGIMGRFVFLKSHNSKFGKGYRQLRMIQWQPPGKMCVIWPEKIKNCNLIYPPW